MDLRELGLSLCEIRSMLELRSGCHTATEFAIRFQQVLAGHLEQAQRRLERMRRVKKELLEALTTIRERLASAGGEQCPCAVAEAAHAPRIVRVLARQQGCCGHAEHHQAAGLDAAPAELAGEGRAGVGRPTTRA